MTTLTITLDDAVFSRLQKRAKEAGVSSEELATAFVVTSTCDDDTDESQIYRAMAQEHLLRFPTVFRRLAE